MAVDHGGPTSPIPVMSMNLVRFARLFVSFLKKAMFGRGPKYTSLAFCIIGHSSSVW